MVADGLEIAVLARAINAVLRAVRIERFDEVALVGRQQGQALAGQVAALGCRA